MAGTLVVLAIAFALGPDCLDLPVPERAMVAGEDISPEPRRVALGDPPIVHVAAFDRDCMDCHMIFKTAEWWDHDRPLLQHRHVQLAHGLNDRCLGCHDRLDRNLLVSGQGETVPFDQSSRHCGMCHGPAYRDWEVGSHGKALGSWDTQSPERARTECVACHDPHAPAYEPYVPLPAPNTLRMGTPGRTPHHGPTSPLMGAAPIGVEGGGH